MKGKILCLAGCQNPVARITKAKEILKNPRPAGSWRSLKCIFSGKGKSRSQRAAKPRSGVILAKGKKAAHSGPQALFCPFYVRKNPTGAVCGSLRARFYRSTKIRLSLILPLRESCWGVPSPNPAMRLTPLKNPSKYFFGFFKNSSALHPVFLLLVRGHHAQPKEVLPCENDITRRTAAG